MKHLLVAAFLTSISSYALAADTTGGGPVGTHANPSYVGGDSGPVGVEVAVGATSHNAGSSIGGLFTLPVSRVTAGGVTISSVLWKSVNGSVSQIVLRLWSRNPVNSTCTDGSSFVGSDADDAYLVGAGPFAITPAAPASTTGDASTYGSVVGIAWSFRNADTTAGNTIAPSVNVYACAIRVSSDTADESHSVRLTISGQQD